MRDGHVKRKVVFASEAKQSHNKLDFRGLLRRCTPRNDVR